jgi:asparagine synthase (glutamine-hydrolysing)
LVLGQLFEADGRPTEDQIDISLSESGAVEFTSRFWGSYVALGQADGNVRVLRDPSGGLACYHAQIGPNHYVTTLPHLLTESGLLAAQIDWPTIGSALIRHAARLPGTALRGIDEVLPGELRTFSANAASTLQAWDPWRYAKRDLGRGAADTLEQVLCSTLATWGRGTRRPLIEISGGLDSAIVAAGIALAAPGASLITFAAAPGDPDETAYARAVAAHLGMPLEIAYPDLADVDLTCSLSAHLPRPNARAFTQAADMQSLRIARAIDADAFFSGGGGDDVFCYLRTILPALDRLRAEGVTGMLATASDIATMTHSTLWDALPRIVRRLARGHSVKSPLDGRLISRDYLAQIVPEPRLSPERDALPGKADHVRGVLTIHNYLEGHARSEFAPILSPLLSQPIVECCLAIPTWMWCEGGRNRAVARRAFSARLPQIVLDRSSKGSFDGFCARLLELNRSLVSEWLMEGCLADQGFLDRDAIAAALRVPAVPAETVARILALVDVESWVRSWRSRPSLVS